MSQGLKKSPLGAAQGLGSAKEGVHHWWVQRVSSVLMIPLALFLAFSFVGLESFDFVTVKTWLKSPWIAASMLMFVVTMFYHSEMGVQVVVEDYLHGKAKVITMMLSKFFHILLGVASALAVLKVALG